MAVVAQALSPWPGASEVGARAAAVARLKQRIAGRDDSDETIAALGETASARVEKEAPGAPQAIRDQAVIRYAGYMAQSDFGGIQSETLGPRTVTYAPQSHANAWRHSGASGLLAPWKRRRGGVVA